jgi:antitoxin component of MazEF toxin-antitoxin module
MDFERQLIRFGEASLGIVIPIDVVKFLGLDDKDMMMLRIEKGKHGEYISIWKKPKE